MTDKSVKSAQKADLIIQELMDSFYVQYQDKNYVEAITTLKIIVSLENNEDFWIYSRLSSCHYELLEYETALSFAKKAFQIQPNSPLVLWD